MKIRHCYTVIREAEIPDDTLEKEINFFRAIQDEPDEYLYDGASINETIVPDLLIYKNNQWISAITGLGMYD